MPSSLAPLPTELFDSTALRDRLGGTDAIAACKGAIVQATEYLHQQFREGAPVETDNGGLIYDLALGAIEDAEFLASALKGITGVVEHGLFIGLAQEALIAAGGAVEHLTLEA